MTTRVTFCQTCDATGSVVHAVDPDNNDECPNCEGSGLVYVESSKYVYKYQTGPDKRYKLYVYNDGQCVGCHASVFTDRYWDGLSI